MRLLAQVSPDFFLRSIQGHSSQTDFMPYFLAILGSVALAIAVWAVVSHVRAKRKPLALFFELARMHGLGRAVQRRLLRLAHSHKVAEPATLFVCPDLVRRVESVEVTGAHSERARRDMEDFFSGFRAAAFGEPPREAEGRVVQ